ncbi:hypothetical protein PV11_03548 [Exophiala sideris]|uniref:Uncharacterized protein n=1 Tax=Exophiala sideris TaxID=1016849 RepID=A0A0D1YEJ5_9EURO|nr:hypothetical protein PV11_03548 [Exophiala sideris]
MRENWHNATYLPYLQSLGGAPGVGLGSGGRRSRGRGRGAGNAGHGGGLVRRLRIIYPPFSNTPERAQGAREVMIFDIRLLNGTWVRLGTATGPDQLQTLVLNYVGSNTTPDRASSGVFTLLRLDPQTGQSAGVAPTTALGPAAGFAPSFGGGFYSAPGAGVAPATALGPASGFAPGVGGGFYPTPGAGVARATDLGPPAGVGPAPGVGPAAGGETWEHLTRFVRTGMFRTIQVLDCLVSLLPTHCEAPHLPRQHASARAAPSPSQEDHSAEPNMTAQQQQQGGLDYHYGNSALLSHSFEDDILFICPLARRLFHHFQDSKLSA